LIWNSQTSSYDNIATGKTYNHQYDSMLRASGLTDGSSNALIQSVTYGVADELTGLQNLAGISGGQPNYYQETRTYNSRFQLTRLTAIMPTNYANSRIDIGYTYSATQNNGQITQEKNWISGEEVNYAYDALNRLITAQTTGPQWGLSWSYDGFGNRTSQTVTKGSGPAASLAINAANNRITTSGYGYDSNGNLTQMPGQTSVFDIENRLGSASGSFGAERYGYDPSNQRVYKKKPDGSEEFYLYGASGELVETFKIVTWAPWVAPAAVETRVYFGGRVVRYVDPQAKSERAIWVDRVGSMRLKAGFDNGNFSAVQPQNYPYGENRTPGTDRFATYFRDSNTGLDYAMNRYYGSNLGRFLTPDPFGGSANAADPKSWNRYAYVGNDPINRNDPAGLLDIDVNSCGAETIFDGERIIVVGMTCELTPGGGDSLFGNPEDTFFSRALLQLENAKSYMYDHFNNSAKCEEDLAKFGTNLDELVSQVGAMIFANGRTSFSIPYSSLFPEPAASVHEKNNPGLRGG